MSSSNRDTVVESDVLDREHVFPTAPARVVSLIPSLTETLFDLGVGENVVGVTNYCIFPPIPADRARIGGTKNPDVDAIRELRPDLVYVNVEENLRRDAGAIESFAPVFATEPASVSDVCVLISQLGRIHRVEERAAFFVERIIELTPPPERQFTFVCPIWSDPWMWCGGDTYVSDLVTRVGGRNLVAEHARYPRLALEQVLELEPDVIFLPDEPYLFEQEHAVALRQASSARVIGPFPGHLFTWHGTRTIAGLEFLQRVMRTGGEGGENVAAGAMRKGTR